MRILVVTQYFYPEDFKINELVKGFVCRGHQVTVLTGKPNYPSGKVFQGYRQWGVQKEEFFGATVIRVPLIPRGSGSSIRLVFNYFSFVFFSCLYVLLHRLSPDSILCWDTSPITQAYAGLLVKKQTGAPVSLWVQDLWPESIEATGKTMPKVVMKWLTKMVRNIYSQVDTLFIQAKNFKTSIEEKGNFKAEYVYAPNWAEDFFLDAEKIEKEKYASLIPNGFVVMFAGNIGAAQDFVKVIEAAEKTRSHPDIHWVIVGDGRRREEAERKANELKLQHTVHFLGRYPVREMPSFFVHADVMLVSLRDEYIFSLTIPSKTQSYMAFGKPIVTMLNGVGNDIVIEADCGLTANAGDAQTLADNVIRLSKCSDEELQRLGSNGKNYYMENFQRNKIIDRILSKL